MTHQGFEMEQVGVKALGQVQVFFSHVLLHQGQVMRGEGALVAIVTVVQVVVVDEGIELVLRSTHSTILFHLLSSLLSFQQLLGVLMRLVVVFRH